ncbi:MAG: porin [Pseudomonadota bacterium]|nr:porin [Pseudomonadota bacterium]
MKNFSKYTAATLLAVTALGAHAQSSVTVYGLIDLSIGSTKPVGGVSQTGIDSGKLTTSYFGFRGTEDLGGGLSAVFKLEGFLRADTGASGRFNGDTQFSRNAVVGLSSKDWGSLMLGRNTTPLFVSTLSFNAFGDSFGYSPSIRHYFTSGTVTGDSAWSNSVLYASPDFGGLKFGLIAAAKGGANGNSNGANWGANAGYAAGPLSAALVFQDVKKDGTAAVDDTRTWQLGGSYDFGVAKTFVQLGEVRNSTTDKTYRLADAGARIPVGNGNVLLQYGRLTPDAGGKTSTVSLGYSYSLSKRTELYAALMHDRKEQLSAGSSYSLGLRHRF